MKITFVVVLFVLELLISSSAVNANEQVGSGACDDLRDAIPDGCDTNPLSLENLIYSNPDSFLSDFCESDCAKPVYEYFADCNDIGFANFLDLSCTKNSEDTNCVKLYTDNNLITVSQGVCVEVSEEQCSSECSSALQDLSMEWGCCVYTYSIIVTNITFTNGVWSQCGASVPGVCEGALSGERTDVPGSEGDACVDLRDAIPDGCDTDQLSLENLIYSNPDRFLSDFCESDCAKPVYDYFVECKDIGSPNILDLSCTKNSEETNCVKLYTDDNFIAVSQGICVEVSEEQCSAECSGALQDLSMEWGCCVYTYSIIETNITFTNGVWSQCGASVPGVCEGALSGERTDVPGSEGDACVDLRDAIPDGCDTDQLSLENLIYSNPDRFLSDFCESNCAKPVYDYFVECKDIGSPNILDLSCTKNSEETNCVKLYTDDNFIAVSQGICVEVSEEQCSAECSGALQDLSMEWGCCVYTYSIIETNITFTNGVWSQCGVSVPGVCEGALSVDSSAVSIVANSYSTLLLFATLIVKLIF